MLVRKISASLESKESFNIYRNKAHQSIRVMRMCLQDHQWDMVLLNGVHAAIYCTDAICVFLLGQRSKSKDHRDASALLRKAMNNESGKTNAARLIEILNHKNSVEYEPRLYTEKEALAFAMKVERFTTWAESVLP